MCIRDRCVREPRCIVRKEDHNSRITEYDNAAISAYNNIYGDPGSTYDYNNDRNFLDLYNFGWRENKNNDRNRQGDIFKCAPRSQNAFGMVFLGVRNYIKYLLLRIYRKYSSFGIGLILGLSMVISFNVLLNKILDKKKPKKNRDTSLNGSI